VLGIVFDPDYASNHYIYIYYTTGPGAKNYSGSPKNRVSRFTTANRVGTDETVIVDNIPSDAGNHNGGDIHFGFDGKLYIAAGDGGSFHDDAQTLNTLRGKLLRVNSNGTLPSDNPHANDSGVRRCGDPAGVPSGNGPCGEVFAYGFRNPFRFGLRQSNSSYIVADVGENTWEEVDSLVADGNFAWNVWEGPCPTSNANCEPATQTYPPQYQYPIHYYKHSGAGETGDTVIGGAFAENSTNYPSPYAGAYFYGDYSAGWVHVLTMDANNVVTQQLDFDTLSSPVDFQNGADGNIYVASINNGKIYKYVYQP
jgi:glucose/arabinose dehydrogenase